MEESNIAAEGADLGNRWHHNRIANFIKEERPWHECEVFNPICAGSMKALYGIDEPKHKKILRILPRIIGY